MALAGPSRPAGGDPDIWDRAKPPVNSPPRSVTSSAITFVDIDMAVFKVNLKQQGATSRVTIEYKGLPTSSRVFGTR